MVRRGPPRLPRALVSHGPAARPHGPSARGRDDARPDRGVPAAHLPRGAVRGAEPVHQLHQRLPVQRPVPARPRAGDRRRDPAPPRPGARRAGDGGRRRAPVGPCTRRHAAGPAHVHPRPGHRDPLRGSARRRDRHPGDRRLDGGPGGRLVAARAGGTRPGGGVPRRVRALAAVRRAGDVAARLVPACDGRRGPAPGLRRGLPRPGRRHRVPGGRRGTGLARHVGAERGRAGARKRADAQPRERRRADRGGHRARRGAGLRARARYAPGRPSRERRWAAGAWRTRRERR